MYSDITIKAVRRKRPLKMSPSHIKDREEYTKKVAAGICVFCSKPRVPESNRFCEFHMKKMKWWKYQKPVRKETPDTPEEQIFIDPEIRLEQKYLIRQFKNEHN